MCVCVVFFFSIWWYLKNFFCSFYLQHKHPHMRKSEHRPLRQRRRWRAHTHTQHPSETEKQKGQRKTPQPRIPEARKADMVCSTQCSSGQKSKQKLSNGKETTKGFCRRGLGGKRVFYRARLYIRSVFFLAATGQ